MNKHKDIKSHNVKINVLNGNAKKRKVKAKQTGKSNLKKDLQRKSKAPGKRKSKTGKTYYEHRKNRSDMPGTLTGINKKFIDHSIIPFYK